MNDKNVTSIYQRLQALTAIEEHKADPLQMLRDAYLTLTEYEELNEMWRHRALSAEKTIEDMKEKHRKEVADLKHQIGKLLQARAP